MDVHDDDDDDDDDDKDARGTHGRAGVRPYAWTQTTDA
jgi:hypothetical protein